MELSASFFIRGHTLLPIVQDGMGVGISAHRLAGTVARAASAPSRRPVGAGAALPRLR